MTSALPIHRGERGKVLLFFAILTLSIASYASVEVVSTTGFFAGLGPYAMPIVFIGVMIIGLVSSVPYSFFSTRLSMPRLFEGLLTSSALSLAFVRLLIACSVPDAIIYSLLFIVSSLQLVLFGPSYWALASQRFDVESSRRLFPLVSTGWLIGLWLGSSGVELLGSLLGVLSLSTVDLHIAASLAFTAGTVVLLRLSGQRGGPARGPALASRPGMGEAWRKGLDFVRGVPLLRDHHLRTFLCNLACMTLIFQLMERGVERYVQLESFQHFYIQLVGALALSTLLTQITLSSRILSRLKLRVLVILPLTLLLGFALSAARHDLAVVAVFFGLMTVTRDALDVPSRQTLQGLVPDAQRPQVAVLGSALFALSRIAACLIQLGHILLRESHLVSPTTGWVLYNLAVMPLPLLALHYSVGMHRGYGEGLLNWRLSRRPRRSAATRITEI